MTRIKALAPSLAILLFITLGAGCFGGGDEVVEEASMPDVEDVQEAPQYIQLDDGEGALVGTLHLLDEDEEVIVKIIRGGQTFDAEQDLQIAYGDTIKVEKGEAVIAYNQLGVTYLQEGAEVIITFPIIGETDQGQTKDSLWVRVETFGGRSWSRIEKLLELTDTFEVGAGNVIATIRGTAFDFSFTDGQYKLVVGGRTVKIVHRDDFSKRVTVTGGNTFEATEEDIATFLELDSTDLQAQFVRPSTPADLSSSIGTAMLMMIEDRFITPPTEPVFLPIEPQIPIWMIGELNPEDRDRMIDRLEASDEDADAIRGVESEGGMIRVDMGAIELLGETFDEPVQ